MLTTQASAAARQQPFHPLSAARPTARRGRVAAPGASELRTSSQARQRTRAQYAAAALYSSVDSSMGLSLGFNGFALVAAALAAYFITQRKDESEAPSGRSECPRCNGTGKEVCFCSRWSDGDRSGCSSCNHTGYTRCKACGGGGNAVPIPLLIPKDEPVQRGTGGMR